MSNDEYEPSELSDSGSAVESGLNLLKKGDAAGAAQLFEQAAAVNPADAAALQYLGIARTQMGDAMGGVTALRRAADLLPDNAGIWCNLGVALGRTGSADAADAARGALQQALALDPNHAKARAALAALPPATAPTAPDPAFMAPAYAMPTLGAPAVPPQASVPLPPASSYAQNSSARPAGGAYAPPSPVRVAYAPTDAPASGTRIARGLGWGFVCGQYWTAWKFFWDMVYGNAGHSLPAILFHLIAYVVIFGIVGSIVGLIAGAINANFKTGAIIGIVAGMLLFAAEFLLLQGGSALLLLNVFFWFVTGRFVGANTVQKIQRAG